MPTRSQTCATYPIYTYCCPNPSQCLTAVFPGAPPRRQDGFAPQATGLPSQPAGEYCWASSGAQWAPGRCERDCAFRWLAGRTRPADRRERSTLTLQLVWCGCRPGCTAADDAPHPLRPSPAPALPGGQAPGPQADADVPQGLCRRLGAGHVRGRAACGAGARLDRVACLWRAARRVGARREPAQVGRERPQGDASGHSCLLDRHPA